LNLIRGLCTRVGMIMEDASVEALTIPTEEGALRDRLMRLADVAHAISAIVAAAGVLSRSNGHHS
jgi:hypothetical protein